jgi:hypothetical protein
LVHVRHFVHVADVVGVADVVDGVVEEVAAGTAFPDFSWVLTMFFESHFHTEVEFWVCNFYLSVSDFCFLSG